jgi:enoyl-CoA hydratase
MTSEALVLVEHEGPVSVMTVNRPPLNPLNRSTLEAMRHALQALGQRPELRCLILTGAGDKAFVGGADIAEMSSMDPQTARRFAILGHAVMSDIERLRVPVIAAVNGYALGGGCELALACDFIFASNKARFGQPEVKLGIVPGFGGTQRLSRRVPWGMARELIFTGRMVSAEEALRIGLVNVVCEHNALLDSARASALEISKMGPHAVREAKRLMREGAECPLHEGLAAEVEAFAACFAHPNQREGMQAFLEKRPPEFSDPPEHAPKPPQD